MISLLHWLNFWFLGTTTTITTVVRPKRIIHPVLGRDGCVGHLLQTCRGWRACDSEGRTLGYFQTPAEATRALAGHQPKPRRSKR